MITLTDNSLKKCNNKNIKLSLMLTLLTGDTWYGKYGFRPIEIYDNKYIIADLNNNYYENNKKTMNKIKISEINLMKFIKMTNNTNLITASKKIITDYPSMLLKDYLSKILKDYDKLCENFITFYEILYNELGLFNFYKQTFGIILQSKR